MIEDRRKKSAIAAVVPEEAANRIQPLILNATVAMCIGMIAITTVNPSAKNATTAPAPEHPVP